MTQKIDVTSAASTMESALGNDTFTTHSITYSFAYSPLLESLTTIDPTDVTISMSTSTTQTICSSGSSRTHTIVMQSAVGNLPRLGIWSSVVDSASPSYFSTGEIYYYLADTRLLIHSPIDDTTSVLTLSTDDGRDDNVKICNGIGKCNYDTAVCECPHGWTYDATLGPCARVVVNNTRWGGTH